jgi:peptidoglycan/LPS O-acetylase OafA/YrhL
MSNRNGIRTEVGGEAVAPPPGNPRFPFLDGLRAVAAGLVLLFHVVLHTGSPVPTAIRELSQLGVAIFFVLSGFLLFRPFTKARLDGDGVPSVRAYARRRVLRIFPAYWAALSFALLIAGATAVTATRIPIYYSLLLGYFDSTRYHGLPVAWTLTIELTYYALLPLVAFAALAIARRLPRGPLQLLPDGLAVAGFALIPAAVYAARPGAPATILSYGDWFAGGMLLATVTFVVHRRLSGIAALGSWLAAIAVFEAETHTSGYAAHLLLIVAALLIVTPAVFAPERGIVSSVLRWPALAWLGLVSYGIYLWHMPVLALIDPGHQLTVLPLLTSTAVLTVAIAAASFYFLEAPILRFKTRTPADRQIASTAEIEKPAVAGLSELPMSQRAAT